MPKNHKPNCQCCICKTIRGESTVWNKGLTKETDSRVVKNVESRKNNGKPWHSEETIQKIILGNKGKKHTNPNCQCMTCKAKRGEYKGTSNPMSGKYHTKDTIQKISKSKTGTHYSEKARKNHKGMLNKHHTEETKREKSKTQKQLWQNPEYKEKQLKAMFKSLDIKPNKPEQLLNSILQQLFPNQYKYVGDGQKVIAGKCPDFINESKHKIIELFGDYWHSEEFTGRNKIDEEQMKIGHFSKHGGYQTLIIWEHELNDLNKLKIKLIEFCKLDFIEVNI